MKMNKGKRQSVAETSGKKWKEMKDTLTHVWQRKLSKENKTWDENTDAPTGKWNRGKK